MARFNLSVLKNRSGISKIADLIIVISFIYAMPFLNSCVKDPTIPILITNPVTDITTSSVTITGKITCDGGSPVTVRGICWGTSFGPSVDDSHTTEVEDSVIFSATITDLDPKLYTMPGLLLKTVWVLPMEMISRLLQVSLPRK